MRFFIEAAAVLGPGLAGWEASRPVLAGAAPYVAAEFALPRFEALPATERRRVGLPVKLALTVGLEALALSGRQGEAIATVFTSSGSDGMVIHEICDMLAGADRLISPTRFHNSVHNAPSGYWGIATGSRAPSTSLCAYDWSFAAGLVEAATQACTGQDAVLLIAHDLPYPEPLHAMRPIRQPFGCALLLTREPGARSLAACELESGEPAAGIDAASTPMRDAGLEALRRDNPAARSLPVLAALAAGAAANMVIEGAAGSSIRLALTAC